VLPNASPYIYDVKISGFTRSSIYEYIYDISRPRVRPSPYSAVNTFNLGYKNQAVYAVSGTSRCLFSDKYKTHKYSAGRAYSC
jgi:hypothetical protein